MAGTVAEVQTVSGFEEFVVTRSSALQRFAYLVTGSHEEARDAVQEALIGLYPRWERVADKAEAYARRSILNANVSRWRKFGREVLPVEPVASPPDPSNPFAAVEDRDQAARLFATLPVRQRAVVVMRFYEQLSYAEIADALGVAESTARSLVHRALGALRAILQEENHG